ncbi:MAG TPA: hypothetical protein VK402_11450 [Blastococcus sp.]|nr:hypothetical protein [Blastococcus sp.]
MRVAACLLTAAVLATAACDSGGTVPDTTGAPSRSATAAPSTTTSSGPPPAPGLAGVEDDPAAGLRGELLQFRRDVAGRRLEVRLTAANDGLVVEALELTTPGLPAAPAVPRGAQLHRDLPLDLPVVLGTVDCSAPAGPPAAEVRLSDAAGGSRTVTVPLDDGGLVRRLHGAECAEQALRAQTAIEVAEVREVSTDDGPALRVAVHLRRIGGSDPVRVTGIGSNTVYSIEAVGPLPTLRQEPVVLDLLLIPARCDTHALGESYRTGLIGLVLALGDDDPRPLTFTPPDDVRRRLETFAVDTCRGRED